MAKARQSGSVHMSHSNPAAAAFFCASANAGVQVCFSLDEIGAALADVTSPIATINDPAMLLFPIT
jgi:hypothetical protein